jgi:hypothetical protein
MRLALAAIVLSSAASVSPCTSASRRSRSTSARSRRSSARVTSTATLAHEVWHLHGISNEASTECNALQTTARAAELFGADSQSAQATAVYALQRLYPNLPDEYRRPDCVNGGPLDLRPADPVWP